MELMTKSRCFCPVVLVGLACGDTYEHVVLGSGDARHAFYLADALTSSNMDF